MANKFNGKIYSEKRKDISELNIRQFIHQELYKARVLTNHPEVVTQLIKLKHQVDDIFLTFLTKEMYNIFSNPLSAEEIIEDIFNRLVFGCSATEVMQQVFPAEFDGQQYIEQMDKLKFPKFNYEYNPVVLTKSFNHFDALSYYQESIKNIGKREGNVIECVTPPFDCELPLLYTPMEYYVEFENEDDIYEPKPRGEAFNLYTMHADNNESNDDTKIDPADPRCVVLANESDKDAFFWADVFKDMANTEQPMISGVNIHIDTSSPMTNEVFHEMMKRIEKKFISDYNSNMRNTLNSACTGQEFLESARYLYQYQLTPSGYSADDPLGSIDLRNMGKESIKASLIGLAIYYAYDLNQLPEGLDPELEVIFLPPKKKKTYIFEMVSEYVIKQIHTPCSDCLVRGGYYEMCKLIV